MEFVELICRCGRDIGYGYDVHGGRDVSTQEGRNPFHSGSIGSGWLSELYSKGLSRGMMFGGEVVVLITIFRIFPYHLWYVSTQRRKIVLHGDNSQPTNSRTSNPAGIRLFHCNQRSSSLQPVSSPRRVAGLVDSIEKGEMKLSLRGYRVFLNPLAAQCERV